MPRSCASIRLCRWMLAAVGLFLTVGFSSTATAHTTGETYVWLNVEDARITGRVEINLNDVRSKLHIDIAETGDTRLPVLEANRDAVLQYIRQHYRLEADGAEIPLEFTTIGMPRDVGAQQPRLRRITRYFTNQR